MDTKNFISFMRKISILLIGIALIAASAPACGKSAKGAKSPKLKIEWEAPVKVSTGGYGRVHAISGDSLMACYSRGGNDYVRFSTDKGSSWSDEILAMQGFEHTTDKGTATVRCANPEFARLSADNPHHPGRIILAANLRPKDNKSTVHPFSIVCSVSDDGGRSWSGQKSVYASRLWDTDASKGAWEPFVLELPDGTVQIYFTDNTPYFALGDKRGNNISVVESTDGGDSWGPARIVCHSEGGWDGMPVVTLSSGRLYLVVEHKDIRGDYPMMIQCMSCTLDENWPEEIPVNSTRRFYPFGMGPAYEGAPYIISTDKYFLVSCQSAEGAEKRMTDSNSVPEVYVCPLSASSAESQWQWKKMSGGFRPMDIDQSRDNGLWNSLCDLGGDEILCVTQHKAQIFVTRGKISEK